jgi:hypothetical protein
MQEEHMLRSDQNTVLERIWRISDAKRNEVTGKQLKKCYSPYKIIVSVIASRVIQQSMNNL